MAQAGKESLTRTAMCGRLSESDIGREVVLSGWVQRRRDLGGVIFLDLRDRSGIVQVVSSPEFGEAAFAVADLVRNEYVISVRGDVVARDPDTVNPNLETGTIEVRAREVELLNRSKPTPFPIEDGIDVDESVRLRFRYLDLRRPEMQRTFLLRHRAMQLVRRFLDRHGFMEIETPMLTRRTPEGARDYLVPSRVHPGQFYALPQSPQLFKQLLMVSGFERYFQIVRCFRDEDLRADRQPEFTQIDIEMSFMPLAEFQELMERMMAELFQELLGVTVPLPFRRIPYDEAMLRYGSDKPDLRFGLEIRDVTETVKTCGFRVFQGAVNSGGAVRGLNAKGCGGFSRKEIDDLGALAGQLGAKGLAWMVITDEGVKSPIAKFFTDEELAAIRRELGAEAGDLLIFVADRPEICAEVLGQLRLHLGRRLGLIDDGSFAFAWITDFPLFSYDEEEKRWVAEHHPFTMPRWEDVDLMERDPGRVRAQAYDMVLNGYEIGGGSLRIYRREIQEAMFRTLGFSMEEAREKFGFLLEAFEYGAPPHGGMAFGFDRVVMLMAGKSSIRECIAFPKTASASCLLTGAPSEISEEQWRELHIRPDGVTARQ
ncbi:aspartate--tRNA ligase [Kyrpidia spormannii]|uniref:Aspartyl-tRNA synthetase, promiscuous (Also recognizes tRNAasn) n=2 Tax=Kyrpidia spormannii TaxID=2055160 RepID=A0ACA8ZB66_9BACL|nr:aspartate--tRNA ligase [Kyrpidia spormannii]CAB3393278.1 aspartyl-tRNA synthetase, promiscuous (also recognizes tRNAasn) [Kyrpidia spormannii]CAB3394198.1 aspartyl-tRNA synthetase, promiscuous (also recognizes tRNAasn) [Kyrpidia spormannii]